MSTALKLTDPNDWRRPEDEKGKFVVNSHGSMTFMNPRDPVGVEIGRPDEDSEVIVKNFRVEGAHLSGRLIDRLRACWRLWKFSKNGV